MECYISFLHYGLVKFLPMKEFVSNNLILDILTISGQLESFRFDLGLHFKLRILVYDPRDQ
jgi:hypothetical protein